MFKFLSAQNSDFIFRAIIQFLESKFHFLGIFYLYMYSHLSNNRGVWNKREGVKKLQNKLDIFPSIFMPLEKSSSGAVRILKVL